MDFATNAKANAGLTTGIIGTAGFGLQLLNNLLGGGCSSGENTPVTRYELAMAQESAAKDAKISLLESNIYNDSKMLELYKYVDGKFDGVNATLSQQAVVNAQVAANLSCMQGAINTLQALTKTVVPIDSICPAPMPQYNSWTAPTAG